MQWEIELKPQVQEFRGSLKAKDRDRLDAALNLLSRRGPGLGRQFVDSVKGSRHSNMKELRVGTSRALFAFDGRRHAVILVAGDKQNDWKGWYQRNIPIADRAFDQHNRSVGGGEQRWRTRDSRAKAMQSGR